MSPFFNSQYLRWYSLPTVVFSVFGAILFCSQPDKNFSDSASLASKRYKVFRQLSISLQALLVLALCHYGDVIDTTRSLQKIANMLDGGLLIAHPKVPQFSAEPRLNRQLMIFVRSLFVLLFTFLELAILFELALFESRRHPKGRNRTGT